MLGRQPWLKFWIDDLFCGPARAATLATQAVYFRLMAVAHTSDPYGVVDASTQKARERLARAAGVRIEDLASALAELKDMQLLRSGRLVFERLQRDRLVAEAANERSRRFRSKHGVGDGGGAAPAPVGQTPTRPSSRAKLRAKRAAALEARCPDWASVDPEFWMLIKRRKIVVRAPSSVAAHLQTLVDGNQTVAGRPYRDVAPVLWRAVEQRATVWNPVALVRYGESMLNTCRAMNCMPGEATPTGWERQALEHARDLEAL